MYLNKAILVGNITRDPELKSLPSGMKVCSFSIATNRVWKDKNGAKQESADFHNIVVFGNQAESTAQYMKKGSQVMIEGRIQTRSWDDKTSGEKKYRTEIVADRVQFGNKPGGNAAKVDWPEDKPEEEKKPEQGPVSTSVEYPEEDINPDDIPF